MMHEHPAAGQLEAAMNCLDASCELGHRPAWLALSASKNSNVAWTAARNGVSPPFGLCAVGGERNRKVGAQSALLDSHQRMEQLILRVEILVLVTDHAAPTGDGAATHRSTSSLRCPTVSMNSETMSSTTDRAGLTLFSEPTTWPTK